MAGRRREKADRLVEESKARAAQKMPRIKLPRVNSEQFIERMLDESPISAKDKEKLERKYRELRHKTRDTLKSISVRWEEECVILVKDSTCTERAADNHERAGRRSGSETRSRSSSAS